jgi:DNA-binding transcriptional regulator YhcF (GntR family)
MARPTRVEVNCTTGEETITELTDSEIVELEQMQAKAETDRLVREAEEKAKADARVSAIAKLAELGLTEDEAKAIAG